MKQKKLNSWSSKNSKHTHILFYLVATLIEPPKNGVAAAYRVKIHFHSGTIWIPWGLSLVLFLLPSYLHFLLLMPPKNVWQDNAVQFVSSSWILQDKLNRSIYHRCTTSSTLCQTCRLKLTPPSSSGLLRPASHYSMLFSGNETKNEGMLSYHVWKARISIDNGIVL